MTSWGRILVLGTGVTGTAVARFSSALVARGEAVSVTLADSRPVEEFPSDARELASIGVDLLDVTDGLAGAWDLCVASPGISPFSSLYAAAETACGEVVSEPEFAYRLSPRDWIVVTGTNGKTTTTSLIEHLFHTAGVPARAVGNIGPTCIDAVADRRPGEVFVAELSSFQLHSTRELKPHVAVVLNVTPDHLEWHRTLEHYAASKAKVLSNMGAGDFAIFDRTDPGARKLVALAETRGITVLTVDPTAPGDAAGSVDDGVLSVQVGTVTSELLPVDDLLIKGTHNVVNALCAAGAALAWGLEPHAVADGLATFAPIAHRIEPVGEVEGVGYFNDSKATNTDAVIKALTAFGDRPLILLLGGYDKGTDLSELVEAAAARCKAVVLFGAAAPRFAEAFSGSTVEVRRAATMSDAVEVARELASAGDAVLLSPACASYDEFTSYAHRGTTFRACVEAMGGVS